MHSRTLNYNNHMRKLIHILSMAAVLGILALGSCHRRSDNNKSMKGIQQLPKFTVLSLDSSHMLRSKDIPDGRPIVLFLFDPTCSHCQKVTAAILSHRGDLREVRLYFLSNADPKEIDSFSRHNNLGDLSNAFVGRDYQYSFFNAFLPSTIPYMAIYDGKKDLAKVFNGEADIESIIKYTRN